MSANKEYGAQCLAYGDVFAGGSAANLQSFMILAD